MSATPSHSDLLAVASFAKRFEAPGFTPGDWVAPVTQEDGVTQIGWWSASGPVAEWERALYDHQIIDPDGGFLEQANVDFVNRAIREPALVAAVDLHTLRQVLTFLARAERHTGGGWFEEAFATGMAQAATRRLGDFVAGSSAGRE